MDAKPYTKTLQDELDWKLLDQLAGVVSQMCFWFLDSTGYFYQVKIRGTMEQIRVRLASRDLRPLVTADGTGILAKDQVNIPNYRKVLDSAINHSMWLYAVLVVADCAVWVLFYAGMIK